MSDGSFADGGPGSSGIRWSGPYGSDPYSRGSSVFGGNPYGSDRYGRSSNGGRTFSPSRGVVCDRATETCYRGREIDASETRDYFGKERGAPGRPHPRRGRHQPDLSRRRQRGLQPPQAKSATRTAAPIAAKRATISARRRHGGSTDRSLTSKRALRSPVTKCNNLVACMLAAAAMDRKCAAACNRNPYQHRVFV